VGGSFFDISLLPKWVRSLSMLTPNSWANEGFRILSMGGKLGAIQTHLAVLVLMGVLLYGVGALMLSRRGLVGK